MSTPDVLAKLKHLGKARFPHLRGNRLGGRSWAFRPGIEEAFDQDGHGVRGRRRHVDTQLEPPPHSAVEQLGMICCGNDGDIARQLIELH